VLFAQRFIPDRKLHLFVISYLFFVALRSLFYELMNNKNFTIYLLRWNQESNHRMMPWKGESDPYKVWLSEIVLQQTRVEQGMAYYQNFVLAYPRVEDLAAAQEDEVMRLWQGLGYYTRARNLHFTAKDIVANYGGSFPKTYKDLLVLKGVGSYTAAAIASFVFKEKVAVVDGNVIRVLSRHFGIDDAFDIPAGKKIFEEKANALIDSDHPDKYNQAIMDFGATVCKPKNPICSSCPFQESCIAFKENRIGDLPFKSKRTKIKKRYFLAFLIDTKLGYPIQKRTQKDIWEALFELPLVEVPGFEKGIAQQVSSVFEAFSGIQTYDIEDLSEVYKQKLSHQDIHVVFAKIKPLADLKLSKEYLYTRNLTKFAFPKIFILYFRSKSLDLY